jgi:ubiquinone biosynthesis protein
VTEVLEGWADGDFADPDQVIDDIESFLDRYHGLPLAQIRLGAMLSEVTGIVRQHGLCLPPDLAMVVKVFITLEGLGRRLDPAFDMVGAAAPFLRSSACCVRRAKVACACAWTSSNCPHSATRSRIRPTASRWG